MESTVPVYEPHLGEPAATDPLEVAIFEKARSRLITQGVFFAFAAALLVLFLPGGLAVWTVAGVCAAGAVWTGWALSCRIRPTGRLFRLPSVVLTPGPGQLLVSGSKVSIALPGAGPRWAVARMPRSKQLVLVRERRVFMVGPDAGGRVLLAAPGSIFGHFGRVRTEPAAGTEVLPGDVAAAFGREMWRRVVFLFALMPVVAALVWALVEVLNTAFGGSSSVVTPVVAGLCWLVFVLVWAAQTRIMTRALRGGGWTGLGATLDTAIDPGASGAGNATGRVSLPDGAVVHVRFARQHLDLLVNVRDTRRLWVLGEPRRGRGTVVGVPGYPVLGRVKLG